MSIKFRAKPRDWIISKEILDDFVKEIEEKISLNRNFDIPYVAGYNKKGTIIYIDKTMPKGYHNKVGKFINTDKYLMVHEFVEKALIDAFQVVKDDVPYQFCHQMALRAERDSVEADKINWNEYNEFMMAEVKKIGNKKEYDNVPKDLDMCPYEWEDDDKTIDKMHTEAYNIFPELMKINEEKSTTETYTSKSGIS